MTCQEPDMNSPEYAGGALPHELHSVLDELWNMVGQGNARHINSKEVIEALPKLMHIAEYLAWREAA